MKAIPLSHGFFYGLLIGFFIIGCSSNKVTVHTEQAPRVALENLKTFGVVRINATRPRLERDLLMLVRDHLEAKGLQYVNKQADFLVAVKFYTGTYTEYVPPTTLVLREFTPDRTGRREGDLRRQGMRRTEADRMRSEVRKSMRTFAGYVDTLMYQNIQVFFVKPVDRETVDILWHGEVDNQNKETDLMKVAPSMIDMLMKEFHPPGNGRKERAVSSRK